MKLTPRAIRRIKSYKKLWDTFGFRYPGSGWGYFRKNHSLNDGCGQCRNETKTRRAENKQQRAKSKLELK